MPLPEGAHHSELSEGDLLTVGNAGMRHDRIKTRIFRKLLAWADNALEIHVFSETMFSLGPNTARIPDASVLLAAKSARLPDDDVPAPSGPDLAVKNNSKSESATDAEKKIDEYLSAGVQEVWQIYPAERIVRVRRRGSIRDYSASEILTSAVLNGFSAQVASFFTDLVKFMLNPTILREYGMRGRVVRRRDTMPSASPG